MEYFVNEVRVSEQQFAKVYNQLSMSDREWEIDRTATACYIYTYN